MQDDTQIYICRAKENTLIIDTILFVRQHAMYDVRFSKISIYKFLILQVVNLRLHLCERKPQNASYRNEKRLTFHNL